MPTLAISPPVNSFIFKCLLITYRDPGLAAARKVRHFCTSFAFLPHLIKRAEGPFRPSALGDPTAKAGLRAMLNAPRDLLPGFGFVNVFPLLLAGRFP